LENYNKYEISVYLRRKDDEGDADHDDHVKLRGPDIGHKIAISNRGKGDHHVVHGLKKVEVSMSRPLEMLHATHAEIVISN